MIVAVALSNCDIFTRAYIEAMYFTDTGLDSGNAADVVMSGELLVKVITDCATFQECAKVWLLDASARGGGYDDKQAGHDFWMTRNGHGTGFWDRGLGAVGDRLSDLTYEFGACEVYTGDDGLLYC